MTYGVFSDEGCAETGFATENAAKAAIPDMLAGDWEDTELTVHETCPEHPEEKLTECEDCVCSNCSERAGADIIARNGGECDDCFDDSENTDL